MGTRGSPLALAQSRQVAAALKAAHPGLTVTERVIRTTGDKLQGAPLTAIGGKGVFTLEIEKALLDGDIDFAVHSLKDLPPVLPPSLCIAAIPRRAAACDVCVLHPEWRRWQAGGSGLPLPYLPDAARVGTSSLRRRAQLLHVRPDLRVEDLRGNIDTRLRKLEEHSLHAIVLAAAGLERLGGAARGAGSRFRRMDERQFVPAPGQGALAVEARAGDEIVTQLLAALEHAPTRAEVDAERAAMRALDAGCSTPLGVRAVHNAEGLEMWAVILAPDGAQRLDARATGNPDEALALGQQVANALLAQGAAELLQQPA